MSDLITNLNYWADALEYGTGSVNDLMSDAADRIEKLERENQELAVHVERLRTEILSACVDGSNDKGVIKSQHPYGYTPKV